MRYSRKRNPKAEGRNPKSEWDGLEDGLGEDSDFWTWGDEPGTAAELSLREEVGSKAPPRDLEERTAQFGEAIIRFVWRK